MPRTCLVNLSDALIWLGGSCVSCPSCVVRLQRAFHMLILGAAFLLQSLNVLRAHPASAHYLHSILNSLSFVRSSQLVASRFLSRSPRSFDLSPVVRPALSTMRVLRVAALLSGSLRVLAGAEDDWDGSGEPLSSRITFLHPLLT